MSFRRYEIRSAQLKSRAVYEQHPKAVSLNSLLKAIINQGTGNIIKKQHRVESIFPQL
jgi:hypothetical protein